MNTNKAQKELEDFASKHLDLKINPVHSLNCGLATVAFADGVRLAGVDAFTLGTSLVSVAFMSFMEACEGDVELAKQLVDLVVAKCIEQEKNHG